MPGGGGLAFKGGYDARTWTFKLDPKNKNLILILNNHIFGSLNFQRNGP